MARITAWPGRAWEGLARMRPAWRFAIKCAVFVLVLLVMLFPNPVQLLRQMPRYRNPEQLIRADFPGMAEIDATLDQLLRAQSGRDELQIVEAYVLDTIGYEWDWNNWGNADYWPDAEEVWQRGREDCDGRAILAASILRRRGHANVSLVGNLQHIWVDVDGVGILGPQGETNLTFGPDGLRFAIPSPELLLRNAAYGVGNFPAWRLIVLWLTAAVLLFHPARDRGRFLACVAVGLAGLMLLRDWGQAMGETLDLLGGSFLVGAGLLLTALWMAARSARRVASVPSPAGPAEE